REHAASVRAEMSRWTRVPAAAAVARMREHVHAATRALPHPLAAGGRADASPAHLPRGAGEAAAAAVEPVGIRVDTGAVAVLQAVGAGEGARAQRADLALTARVSTFAAVQTARLQVDASPVALGQAETTRRRDQLGLGRATEHPRDTEEECQPFHAVPCAQGNAPPPLGRSGGAL